jgi:hypothetical protein
VAQYQGTFTTSHLVIGCDKCNIGERCSGELPVVLGMSEKGEPALSACSACLVWLFWMSLTPHYSDQCHLCSQGDSGRKMGRRGVR